MPPFVPYPPDSLRSQGGRGSSGGTRFPFTQVYLAALRMGYSRTELAEMPYGEVVFDLAAASEGQRGEDDQGVVMATQDDIRNMLG